MTSEPTSTAGPETHKQVLPGVRTSGRGKRRESVSATRTKRICLRLSDEEHEALARKARTAGVSVSVLLRDHIGRFRMYNHRGQQRWFAVLLSLRAQLTALSERAGSFQPAQSATLIAYVAAMVRHVERLAQQES